MSRTLLALGLALFATVSMAAEAPEDPVEAPNCIKAQAKEDKAPVRGEAASAAARPGTPAPVRPRSASPRGTPRWPSLLPGMFR